MMKSFFKSISILLIIGLNYLGLFSIGQTFAHFNDTETSTANTLQAGSLDFSLSATNLDVVPLDTEVDFDLISDGTLSFQYNVEAETSGDEDFCQDLEILIYESDILQYGGKLANLSATKIISGSQDEWQFILNDPQNTPSGKTCNFVFNFKAWQEELNFNQGFFDTESASGVIHSEGVISPPIPGSGDVIINEVMWMGSKDDDSALHAVDEWIELKNNTDYNIDLTDWQIDNAASSQVSLTLAGTLLANDYFVIANYSKDGSAINVDVDLADLSLSLANSNNGNLILKDKDNNIIDSAKGDIWPAGESGSIKKSMERNDTAGDGVLPANWHTCEPADMTIDELATMKSYWDDNAQDYNCGTPGHNNLSRNDSSADDYMAGKREEDSDINNNSQIQNPDDQNVDGGEVGDGSEELDIEDDNGVLDNFENNNCNEDDYISQNKAGEVNDLNSTDAPADSGADDAGEVSENMAADEEELICSVEDNDNQQENEILTEDNSDDNVDVDESGESGEEEAGEEEETAGEVDDEEEVKQIEEETEDDETVESDNIKDDGDEEEQESEGAATQDFAPQEEPSDDEDKAEEDDAELEVKPEEDSATGLETDVEPESEIN